MIRALGTCVVLICAAGALASPLQDDRSRYVVKTSSKIEFHASSTFAKVVGVFHSWDADMKLPGGKFAGASLQLEIEAASVTTGSGLRDKEVKGKNFFSVQEHPKIRFSSKSIAAADAPTKFHMDGELTIRGITQPLPVSITLLRQDDGHDWIDGSFSFNRRDFGMTHNLPFDKIANTVVVQFHLDTVNGIAPVAQNQSVCAASATIATGAAQWRMKKYSLGAQHGRGRVPRCLPEKRFLRDNLLDSLSL
jgi:polyisoprenoid-binding protein YceI